MEPKPLYKTHEGRKKYAREWARNKRATDLEWRKMERKKNNERMKRMYKENPMFILKKKNAYFKREYGISLEDYDIKFVKQKGNCAICKTSSTKFKKNLMLDHDHKTGKIRGLLCCNCNYALGHLKDDVMILKSAIKYLNRHA